MDIWIEFEILGHQLRLDIKDLQTQDEERMGNGRQDGDEKGGITTKSVT